MLTIELLLALGFLIFAGLCLFLLVHSDRQRRRNRARLRRNRVGEQTQDTKVTARKSGDRNARSGVIARIERELAQTSLRLKPAELLVQVGIGTLSLFALAVLALGLSPLIAMPVALGLPLLTAKLMLRMAKLRYRAAFTDQLPEALDIFARGPRAGRPVADSLAIVVSNSKGPVGLERAWGSSMSDIILQNAFGLAFVGLVAVMFSFAVLLYGEAQRSRITARLARANGSARSHRTAGASGREGNLAHAGMRMRRIIVRIGERLAVVLGGEARDTAAEMSSAGYRSRNALLIYAFLKTVLPLAAVTVGMGWVLLTIPLGFGALIGPAVLSVSDNILSGG